jgi:hypothetical protein
METTSKWIRGLVAEKKAFAEEDPSDDLIDVFNVGAAIKGESYEICEYESLVEMAREMKHSKVAQLLSQNLKEEKATLRKMEAFSEKVKPDQNDERGTEAEVLRPREIFPQEASGIAMGTCTCSSKKHGRGMISVNAPPRAQNLLNNASRSFMLREENTTRLQRISYALTVAFSSLAGVVRCRNHTLVLPRW